MMNYPDVVSKLGLEDHPEDQSLFCRITPTQLKASGSDTPLDYIKKQAVLLFQKDFEDEQVIVKNFKVSLRYKDTDGDMMIIRTSEDLVAALEEHTDTRKIKILAHVEKKPLAETADPTHISDGDDNSSCHSDDIPHQITVQGAGCEAVNGVYTKNGLFEDCCYKYTKHGKWMDRDFEFHIYGIRLHYQTFRKLSWYMAAVPVGGDLYMCPWLIFFYHIDVDDDDCRVPPKSGWMVDEGTSPSPALFFG